MLSADRALATMRLDRLGKALSEKTPLLADEVPIALGTMDWLASEIEALETA